MHRRSALVFGTLGIGTMLGILGWNRPHVLDVPEGMTVETRHREGDVFTAARSRERGSLPWKGECHTTVTTRETAETELVADGSVGRFLNETDFGESYLIVVQNGMQSGMNLVVDAISRTETGLHVAVDIEAPQSGPDDLRVHSLLVRITDAVWGVPEQVTVDIDGYV